jgi:hypothetical protein
VASAAALRNEAIRCTNGQALLFVKSNQTLSAHRLERGLENLSARPEADRLVDASPATDIAAAMYRRSAFEELQAFRGSSAASRDRELAQRAGTSFELPDRDGAFIREPGS